MVSRFSVVLVAFDPTVGSEIAKTRPAVVVSPDQMNRALATVIVAPLTSTQKRWPTRVPVSFAGRLGDVALDQIRAIDRSRIVKVLGTLPQPSSQRVLTVLSQMFQP